MLPLFRSILASSSRGGAPVCPRLSASKIAASRSGPERAPHPYREIEGEVEEGRGEGEMEGSHTDGATGDLVYLFPRLSLDFPLLSSPNISSHSILPRKVSTTLCVGWWVVAPAAGAQKYPEADVDYV